MRFFSAFISVFSASYRTDYLTTPEFPSSGSGLLMVQTVCCWICLFDAGMGGIAKTAWLPEGMNQRSALKWSVQPAAMGRSAAVAWSGSTVGSRPKGTLGLYQVPTCPPGFGHARLFFKSLTVFYSR